MKLRKFAAVISLCSLMILPSFTVSAVDTLPTKAYISGAIGSVEVWNENDVTAGSTVAEINGDAQYEVEWKVSDNIGTSSLTFLAVSIPNVTAESYPGINVNVTAVYIDGVKINYTMSPNALNTSYYESARDPETRVYLYDELKGTNVADLPKLTTITDSIRVVFTVTGTGVTGTSNVQELPTETQTSSETEAVETTETQVAYGNSSPVDASTTGDAGVAVAAAVGLAVTASAAVFSKVKIKNRKK